MQNLSVNPGRGYAYCHLTPSGRSENRTHKAVTLVRFRGGCHRQLACSSTIFCATYNMRLIKHCLLTTGRATPHMLTRRQHNHVWWIMFWVYARRSVRFFFWLWYEWHVLLLLKNTRPVPVTYTLRTPIDGTHSSLVRADAENRTRYSSLRVNHWGHPTPAIHNLSPQYRQGILALGCPKLSRRKISL